tara:strand:- start:104 stop:511 length:408 start_codon:yes stop_codon:yes gene_type:complete
MKKYLYFRSGDSGTGSAVADVDATTEDLCIDADRLIAMETTGDSTLKLHFEPVIRNQSDAQDGNVVNSDSVILNVAANSQFEVMKAITSAVKTSRVSMVTIADDIVDDATTGSVARYIHGSITSCGAIAVAAALS